MAEKTDEPCTRDPGSMLVLLPTFLPMSQTSLSIATFLDCMFFLSLGTLVSQDKLPKSALSLPQALADQWTSQKLHLYCSKSIWKLSPNLRDKFAFTFLTLLHYQSLIRTPTGFSGLTLSSGCFPFWGTLATTSFGFISLKNAKSSVCC